MDKCSMGCFIVPTLPVSPCATDIKVCVALNYITIRIALCIYAILCLGTLWAERQYLTVISNLVWYATLCMLFVHWHALSTVWLDYLNYILTCVFGTSVVFAADENLTFAFEHCHCRARGNKRQEYISCVPSPLCHMNFLCSSMDDCLHCGVFVCVSFSLCLCCLTGGY